MMRTAVVAGLVHVASATICHDIEGGQPFFQLTAMKCECCMPLEDFVRSNDFVHTLFYSRSGRLNMKIKNDFEQTAEDWKHSKVAFGMIDVDTDRKMSEKFNDPTMIPTNILFRHQQPVEVSQDDFAHIRDKFGGSPEGQKWLLTKYMADKGKISLHHARPLANTKRLKKFVKKNEVAIVGFFTGERGKEYKAFEKALYDIHSGVEEEDLEAKFGSFVAFKPTLDTVNATAPSIRVYQDGKEVADGGVFAPSGSGDWKVGRVTDFLTGFLPVMDEGDEWSDEKPEF